MDYTLFIRTDKWTPSIFMCFHNYPWTFNPWLLGLKARLMNLWGQMFGTTRVNPNPSERSSNGCKQMVEEIGFRLWKLERKFYESYKISKKIYKHESLHQPLAVFFFLFFSLHHWIIYNSSCLCPTSFLSAISTSRTSVFSSGNYIALSIMHTFETHMCPIVLTSTSLWKTVRSPTTTVLSKLSPP